MSEKVRVALIGAGRTGTPLLRELLNYPYVEFVGVADLNPAAEGLRLAAERGIFTTSEPMVLAARGEEIDVLVEVSGDPELKRKIKEAYEKSGNKRTIILHDLIARLFMSVCTRQTELVPSFHPHDVGIGP